MKLPFEKGGTMPSNDPIETAWEQGCEYGMAMERSSTRWAFTMGFAFGVAGAMIVIGIIKLVF